MPRFAPVTRTVLSVIVILLPPLHWLVGWLVRDLSIRARERVVAGAQPPTRRAARSGACSWETPIKRRLPGGCPGLVWLPIVETSKASGFVFGLCVHGFGEPFDRVESAVPLAGEVGHRPGGL